MLYLAFGKHHRSRSGTLCEGGKIFFLWLRCPEHTDLYRLMAALVIRMCS